MKALDVIQETHQSLSAKKVRSALTVLGIVVGITAVVVMVSLITGVSAWLEDSMGLGSARVATVTSNNTEYELEYDDVAFLEDNNDDVESVVPVATTTCTIGSVATSSDTDESTDTTSTDSSDDSSDSSSSSLTVVGAGSTYFELQNVELTYGTLFSDEADGSIILDETAVEDIYGDSTTNVVGQTITLDGYEYTIVGIAESSTLASTLSASMGYVSYETMTTIVLGGVEQVDTLLALAVETADVGTVAAEVEGMLAARHGVEYDEDGTQSVYSASTTESSLEMLEDFTLAFDALAAIVAGIALLVGGIGIMNMMLTNVSERYREIGLRKSLGARPRDITLQFLAEAVALCLTGGIAGIILGYVGAWGLVAVIAQYQSSFAGLSPAVTPQLVAIVFCVCTAIGLVFGYYPARRASKLNPAETLRYQ